MAESHRTRPRCTKHWALFALLVLLLALLAGVLLGCSQASPPPEEQVPYFPANFGEKYGYIDADGKTVIAPQFDNAEPFSGSLAQVTIGDRYGFIDKTGKLVTPTFEGAWTFSEGRAAVRVGDKRGYIDEQGKIIIKPQFDVAGEFSQSRAPIEIGGKWGYINSSGKMVTKPQFDLAWGYFEKMALVVVNGKKGFIDLEGKLVIPCRYEDAWRFSEGLAPVRIGGKWGFIDPSGSMVIQPAFDDAWWFSEGLAPVEVGSKWGYVDTTGKLVIPARFDTARVFSGGLAVVRVGSYQGYIDKSGTIVLKPSYNLAWGFVRDRALTRLNGIESYIDTAGNKIWEEASPLPKPKVETSGTAPLPPASVAGEPVPPVGLIVFDGDSLTIGTQATDPYPSQVMRMWGPGVRWWNIGIGGQGIADMESHAAAQVDTKYDARRGRNVVVVWAGTNDMALWLRSPEQVLDLTRQYCEERRAKGFIVVVMTALPRSGRIDPDDFEGRREDFNTLLREHWTEFADKLIDLAADPRFGQPGDELDRRYFDADRVHMNNAGLGEIAKLVYPVLKGL